MSRDHEWGNVLWPNSITGEHSSAKGSGYFGLAGNYSFFLYLTLQIKQKLYYLESNNYIIKAQPRPLTEVKTGELPKNRYKN